MSGSVGNTFIHEDGSFFKQTFGQQAIFSCFFLFYNFLCALTNW
jgi:hypothetical protein